MPVLVIALLGAECTGKSTLCRALAQALPGLWVPEALRDFVSRHGRPPRSHEQPTLLAEQIAREEAAIARAAAQGLGWVLADSAPMATALYSEQLFADPGLTPAALRHHQRYALTLVTGLEVPWEPDGAQRDGPQARADFDARLRRTLVRAQIPHHRLAGPPGPRLEQGLRLARACAEDYNRVSR